MAVDLSFDNLRYVYPGSNGACALNGTTSEFPSGRVVALIGPNGAGKSTLCKVLNGVYRPEKGIIKIAGKQIFPSKRPGQFLAYSFQNPDDQLFQTSIMKELAFGPKNLGLSDSEIKESVDSALRIFGLQNYSNTHPMDLPFVLRKRVSMASAVAMRRPWTVLDEPTVGQDPAFCEELVKIIEQLTALGNGFIIISHDADFVWEICNWCVVLSEGKCIWSGTYDNYRADCCQKEPGYINLASKLDEQLSLPPQYSTRKGLAEYLKKQMYGQRGSRKPESFGGNQSDTFMR
jgi:energy-coupling factor transporter ATP-binding protein EcfA2